jgi:hypothetical protein
MRRIEARRIKARALSFRFSQSLDRRRQRLSQAIVAFHDAEPPFSALFTLWLSMIAAVGLA